MKRRNDKTPRVIARQMALGFGTVTIVTVVMCAALLLIIRNVSNLVSGMRHDEHGIRQAAQLATSVREQSIHIAHALVDPSPVNVSKYEGWRTTVREGTAVVFSVAPEAERWRVAALDKEIEGMHTVFVERALPAARSGDIAGAKGAHREIDAAGTAAAKHADALAVSVESRMAHAHVMATDSTRLGLLVGGAFVLLVLGLSVAFTMRLRAAVLRPLVVLTDAAKQFGRGDFSARVGDVGRGELGALGGAFDRMAEELAVRERLLVRSERMAAIGQLAAGVAHELNNPIGIIRGYLKTMTADSDPETLREELEILDEEAAQCERIAADLLSYARSEQLDLESVDVAEFITESVRRFRASAVAGDVTIDVVAEPSQLEADRSRIRQVIMNLLTNAVQASKAGDTVTVRGAVDGDGYRIEVDDQGPGVSPEDRARVFEPFFSRRRSGTGLGLAVCQGIVESHCGTITVNDGSVGGARFTVHLPLRQAGLEIS